MHLAPPPAAAPAPVVVATPAPVTISAPAPTPAPVVSYRSGHADKSEGLSLSVDRTRQEILLRLSFISAGILGAGFLVLLAFSYLFGKQSSIPSRPVLTRDTTTDMRNRPPQSGVLNLATSRTEVRGGDVLSPGAARTQTPQQPPTFSVDDPKRQAGLYYVVIQSYPQEEMANKAREMLIADGVPCTIEHNMPVPWSSKWYCLVGTRGFSTTTRSQEYAGYLKRIDTISRAHAVKGSFQEFRPVAHLWGKTR